MGGGERHFQALPGPEGLEVMSRGRAGSSVVGRQRVEVIQEMLLTVILCTEYPSFDTQMSHQIFPGQMPLVPLKTKLSNSP